MNEIYITIITVVAIAAIVGLQVFLTRKKSKKLPMPYGEAQSKYTKILVTDVAELTKIMRGLTADGISGTIGGHYQPYKPGSDYVRVSDETGQIVTNPEQPEELSLWIMVRQSDLVERVQEISAHQFIEDMRK